MLPKAEATAGTDTAYSRGTGGYESTSEPFLEAILHWAGTERHIMKWVVEAVASDAQLAMGVGTGLKARSVLGLKHKPVLRFEVKAVRNSCGNPLAPT